MCSRGVSDFGRFKTIFCYEIWILVFVVATMSDGCVVG